MGTLERKVLHLRVSKLRRKQCLECQLLAILGPCFLCQVWRLYSEPVSLSPGPLYHCQPARQTVIRADWAGPSVSERLRAALVTDLSLYLLRKWALANEALTCTTRYRDESVRAQVCLLICFFGCELQNVYRKVSIEWARAWKSDFLLYPGDGLKCFFQHSLKVKLHLILVYFLSFSSQVKMCE